MCIRDSTIISARLVPRLDELSTSRFILESESSRLLLVGENLQLPHRLVRSVVQFCQFFKWQGLSPASVPVPSLQLSSWLGHNSFTSLLFFKYFQSCYSVCVCVRLLWVSETSDSCIIPASGPQLLSLLLLLTLTPCWMDYILVTPCPQQSLGFFFPFSLDHVDFKKVHSLCTEHC